MSTPPPMHITYNGQTHAIPQPFPLRPAKLPQRIANSLDLTRTVMSSNGWELTTFGRTLAKSLAAATITPTPPPSH